MRNLHVAVAQVNSRVGDPKANLERMHHQIRSAAAVDVEVILFAEAAIHGYDVSPGNLALAEPYDGASGQLLAQWAPEYGLSILAGFLERAEERRYVSHLLTRPDGSLEVERKHNLTPAETGAGITQAPRERKQFVFNGVRCAILICADTLLEGIHEELREHGVEFEFRPAAGGGKLPDMMHERELQTPAGRARYKEDRKLVYKEGPFLEGDDAPPLPFAAANALGYDGRSVCHRGHCLIVDVNHVIRAQIPGTNVLEHQHDQMAHAILSFPD